MPEPPPVLSPQASVWLRGPRAPAELLGAPPPCDHFFFFSFFKIFKLRNLLGNCSFQINLRCARFCGAALGARTEPAIPHVAASRAAQGWLLLGCGIP